MINNNILEAFKTFGLPADSDIQKVNNGINSNVFIINDQSQKYILKFYRKDNNTPSRLEREVTALQLFNSNGVMNVPKLLNYSKELNCTLLSFIHGETISEFRKVYIVHFQSFFKEILTLSKKLSREEIKIDAIDCCLEINTINKQIEKRLENLKNENDPQINSILKQIEEIFEIVARQVKKLNKNFNNIAPILSTVDFGINNALIENDKLYFIDFEYFGWDHPIHLISDTICHPANNLNLSEQSALLDSIFECYTVPEELEEIQQAFNGVNLLFDIKWCLIMLNPFLTSYISNLKQSEVNSRQSIQKVKVDNKVALLKLKMKNATFFH